MRKLVTVIFVVGSPHSDPRDFKQLRRREIPNQARAINFSCFHEQPFLRSERACGWFVNAAHQALAKHPVHLWAYCMMPTHVHLLLYPTTEHPDIAAFLESLKKSVTQKALLYVRKDALTALECMRDEQPNGRVSYRFWERGGGYDRNLLRREGVWSVIDYIHFNPVEGGLCPRPEDWAWSSAAQFAGTGSSSIRLALDYLPSRNG